MRCGPVAASISPNPYGPINCQAACENCGPAGCHLLFALGTFLAKRHAQKVLIVDLHPHLGHVAMLLGMDSHSYTFHELLRNVARLDLTLLNSYVVHHSSGVDVTLPA